MSHLAASPDVPGLVFASAWGDTRIERRNGIYRSTDGGQTWALVHKFACSAMAGAAGQVVFAPDAPERVYAAGGCAVAISADSGLTWKESPLPAGTVNAWRIAVAGADFLRRNVWAISAAPQKNQPPVAQIYFSQTDGLHWTRDEGSTPVLWGYDSYPPTGVGVASASVVVEPGTRDRLLLGVAWGAGSTPQLFYTSPTFVANGQTCAVTDYCSQFIGSIWAGDYSNFDISVTGSRSSTWTALPSPPAYGDAGESSGSGNVYVQVKPTGDRRYLLFFSDRNGVHVSDGRPTKYGDWHRFDGKPACLTYQNEPPVTRDVYYVHPDPHALALSPDFSLTFRKPDSAVGDPFDCTLADFSGTAWLGHDGGVSYSTDGENWSLGAGLHTLEIQAGLAGLAKPGATAPALYFGVPDDDNFYTVDGGKKWKDPLYDHPAWKIDCGDCSPWFFDQAQYKRVLEYDRHWSYSLFTSADTYPEATLAARKQIPGPDSYIGSTHNDDRQTLAGGEAAARIPPDRADAGGRDRSRRPGFRDDPPDAAEERRGIPARAARTADLGDRCFHGLDFP